MHKGPVVVAASSGGGTDGHQEGIAAAFTDKANRQQETAEQPSRRRTSKCRWIMVAQKAKRKQHTASWRMRLQVADADAQVPNVFEVNFRERKKIC